MNKKLLAVALVALGVAFFLASRSKKPQLATGTKRTVEGGAIVSVPVGVDAAPLIVFFGGTPSVSYAHKKAIEGATPDSLKKRAVILFVDTGSAPLASYVQQGRSIASREGITVTSVKALGFSAGGGDVQKGFSKDLAFVGLIDPSTNVRYLDLPWNRGTHMIYNTKNWAAKYESIKQAMPRIADAINNAGGLAQSVASSHRDMIPKFFSMYGNDLGA
jgi:hypothetical protein